MTQWGTQAWVPYGVAAAAIAGAVGAYAFMARTHGRVRQSTVMRLLFPVLVVALVPQALFSGVAVLACSLLVIGCYVFLILTSIGFEIRGVLSRARRRARAWRGASRACRRACRPTPWRSPLRR